MLQDIEGRMAALIADPPNQHSKLKEEKLNEEHKLTLLQQEKYWHQRSRINWVLFGDENTRFFHTTAITRKRRNTIRAIKLEDGSWESDARAIRGLFVSHFKGIYSKVNTLPINHVSSHSIFRGLKEFRM